MLWISLLEWFDVFDVKLCVFISVVESLCVMVFSVLFVLVVLVLMMMMLKIFVVICLSVVWWCLGLRWLGSCLAIVVYDLVDGLLYWCV